LRAQAAFGLAVAAIRCVSVLADFDDPQLPSHLHINILPASRGQGVGHALMPAWLDKLGQGSIPRLPLGTLVENEGPRRFFEQSGFAPTGESALLPGMRYRGRRMLQIIMVQELETRQS
jgi:GNAT superfamily N-acetyltransferase